MKMREVINIIREGFRRDAGEVPAVLYHGTSLERFQAIQASNTFREDARGLGNLGFSTTAGIDIAMKFARMSATGRWGVVMTLDGNALAEQFSVERYDDDDEYATNEEEWVVLNDHGPIGQARRFIRSVRLLDTQIPPDNHGWDEVEGHLLPWDGHTLPTL